jgi:transcriptional regulator with PAS, ATPase and Fis domain
VNVNLPPLRERRPDIPLLANHFLKKYSTKYKKQVTGLNKDTLQLLESYTWPGNIRELENVLERIVILTDINLDYIPPELLPENILSHTEKSRSQHETKNQNSKLNIRDKQSIYEKEIILKVLIKNGWNQSVAAEELGLHESTLRYRMRKYGIKKK